MSEKVGNVSFYDSTGQTDYTFSKPYSEKTAELIDEEVKKLIDEQYVRAKQVLSEHAEGHRKLAELLLEREVIFSEDLQAIFGKRNWGQEKLVEVENIEDVKKQNVSDETSNDSEDKNNTAGHSISA
jgi:AFG3 family protein